MKVIHDCDGWPAGHGEFSWAIKIYTSKGSALISKNGSANANDGETFSGVPNPHVFTVPANDGESFKVKFWVSEWDEDIWGDTYRDDEMNNRSGEYTHYFRDGTWTNKTRKITLGVSGCKVEIDYRYSNRGVSTDNRG